RGGDIAELANHFLFLFNRGLGTSIQGFDPEALLCLRQYRWPGHVRELVSVIRQAMLRATRALLIPEVLPPGLREEAGTPAGEQAPQPASLDLMRLIDELLAQGDKDVYAKVMRVVERALFTRVLQQTHGVQGQASERLGLNRSTLRYKLRDLGMSVERVVGDNATDRAGGPDAEPM